jgi:hypothetical protein
MFGSRTAGWAPASCAGRGSVPGSCVEGLDSLALRGREALRQEVPKSPVALGWIQCAIALDRLARRPEVFDPALPLRAPPVQRGEAVGRLRTDELLAKRADRLRGATTLRAR